MAEDERLREALLELQFLREREARILNDTKTLLECLEAYSTASSPGDALASIFVSLQQKTGASLSILVTLGEDKALVVTAADKAEHLEKTILAPFDVFSRSRNISDLALLGEWSGTLDLSSYAGLIVAPVSDRVALMTAKATPHAFRKDDINLVQRLSGLAAQAWRNSALAAENDLLAATISGAPTSVLISTGSGQQRSVIYANRAYETISGRQISDVVGAGVETLTASMADTEPRARLERALAKGEGGTFLVEDCRADGAAFWNEISLFPVRDLSGATRHIVTTQTDVTDRVVAAQERDRLQGRMERALAATEDAFLVLELGERVAFANSAVDLMFPAPEVSWAVGTDFDANWAAYLSACEDLPGRITSLLRVPDLFSLAQLPAGREIDLPDGRSVLLRAGLLDDGELVVSATDVTAMKSAQNLLTQRLAAIEAATDGIAVSDTEGRLIYLNSAASNLLGFEVATTGLGRKWRERYTAPPQRQAGEPFAATVQRDVDGKPLTHEITGSPLAEGGAVIVIRDITENLETEAREEDLMQELIRLQRQEAIAQLTAGVAHDFNNLLSSINGSATLIGMTNALPQDVRPHLDRIIAAGSQSAKLVSRLLDIGAGAEAEGTFELSSVLSDLRSILTTSLPERVMFRTEARESALALKGSPGTLSQVLINLALNAGDAIGSGSGHIDLSVSECAGHEARSLVVGQLKDTSRYARLAMRDDGAGMDMDTAAEVFKPYYTTKGRQGTGLGLATAALQVRAIGGGIGLDTVPGEGTTITIFWPLAPMAPLQTGALSSAKVHNSDLSGITVIVVDDDEDVRAVIATYLESQGAEVASCEDPRDAAAAIAEDPKGWSALITDYDMPIMNGGALAAEVNSVAPDLPVFVVTALAKRLSDPRLADGKAAGIFPKPVDLESLSQALAAAVKTE
ncbi:MAG: PAS domain S-box protein [Pseudomonadota bacterium]